MPATVDYNTQLRNQLKTASENKRIALQNQYDRATGAQFNKDTGALTYRTDASGNPLYGTLDVDYMEQQRGINTQAEGAGMLRSGQRARNLATSEAGYRATIGGLAESLAAGKTAISDEEALKLAEYDALYGSTKSGGGGGGGAGGSTSLTPSSGLPPVPPVPTAPTAPRTPTTATPRRSSPTSADTAERRATSPARPAQGPVQGPSRQGPGNFVAPKTVKPGENLARRPTPPPKPPLPKTTRR
jgi:hypothetical protein